jgi:hypothetical protein
MQGEHLVLHCAVFIQVHKANFECIVFVVVGCLFYNSFVQVEGGS